MNTRRCVLGVVLRTLPALVPLACAPGTPPPAPREESPRGGASKRAVTWPGGPGAVLPGALPPPTLEVPTHPCELITVMRVPCDATLSTCEETWWECPAPVKPLRA